MAPTGQTRSQANHTNLAQKNRPIRLDGRFITYRNPSKQGFQDELVRARFVDLIMDSSETSHRQPKCHGFHCIPFLQNCYGKLLVQKPLWSKILRSKIL